MRIICAPNSFKESLTAAEAAQAMARGIHRVDRQALVDLCPVADGGDGTVDALLTATGGQACFSQVDDPLGRPVSARWAMLGQMEGQPLTAVIEMATASGMALLTADQRNPMRTSSRGTGQLIAAAMDAGARHIILGIGGSATNDGGCGAVQALGGRFYDREDRIITAPITGGLLPSIGRIELSSLDQRVQQSQISVACDVTNPLTGPRGAAFVYAPQKGADAEGVRQLDAGLVHLAALMREQLGRDVEQTPGAGAAGGMGAGLLAMLGARLQPGAAMILEAVRFDPRVKGCDLCLTGEGRLDGQSLSGKACLSVAQAARRWGVKTVALVGSLGPEVERTLEAGLHAYHCINPGLSEAESISRAADLLEQAAAEVVARWPCGSRQGSHED